MATKRTTPASAAQAQDVSEATQTALVAPTQGAGTALALPAAWAAKLAAQAKDVAASERPSVAKIGLRGGLLSYGGQEVKGNVLPVVILAAGHRNTYYDKPFDPNNLQNPVCFALSLSGEDMEAHENVPDENVPGERDGRDCGSCPFNEWGSDPKGGRGKACKETRRLVVLPEDALESAEACLKAEMAIIDIPVTSGKNYSNFVNGLAAAAGVPPWAAITQISTVRDAKTQFKVTFTPTEVVQDVSVLEALEKRMGEAERLMLTPYDEVSSTESGKMADGAGVGQAAKKAKY